MRGPAVLIDCGVKRRRNGEGDDIFVLGSIGRRVRRGTLAR